MNPSSNLPLHMRTAGFGADGPPSLAAALPEAALVYARRDWPVFPLKPRDKVPLIPKAEGGNGVHDATTDPDRIRAWWEGHPTANIGLACGPSFWVLDVDYKGFFTDEPDGADTLLALRRRFGPLPSTVRQYTGGLGWQHLFQPDPRIRNGVKVLPGIDTRAAGGYIVAPPSIPPDTGRTYRWIVPPGKAPIATAPAWLVALLSPVEAPHPVAPARPVRTGDLSRYAEAALAKAAERISAAAPGQQCEVLDHEAFGIGRLVAGGVIPRRDAEAALVAAGCAMRAQVGRRPWRHGEVAWRVGRAIASGLCDPRTPEARP